MPIAQGTSLPTATICGALEVSRSAYYDWLTREPGARERERDELTPAIVAIFVRHRRRYGARRIASELADEDIVCSATRLASSDRALYATYYELAYTLFIPEGTKWDILRRVVDAALFPGYQEKIRFAALSANGGGLRHYGSCTLALDEVCVGHRASAFEENACNWARRQDIRMAEADRLPRGYRAVWADRARLAAAKLYPRLLSPMTDDELRSLLLSNGDISADDEFVEVHIYEALTIRSCAAVAIGPCPGVDPFQVEVLRTKLAAQKVQVEGQSCTP